MLRVLALLVLWCGVAAGDTTTKDGPCAIVLVVDGSMTAEKRDLVRDAIALAPIEKGDRISVVSFEKDRVASGFDKALAALKKSKLRKKRAILVSDGVATLGVANSIAKLREAGVAVSAVGIDSNNRVALDAITKPGRGRTHQVGGLEGFAGVLVAEARRPMPEDEITVNVFVLDRSRGAKIDFAKEIVRMGIELSSTADIVAVVAHDSDAFTIVRPQRATNRMRISADIARVEAGGAASLGAGLREAEAILKGISATTKNVIVVPSGHGSLDGVADFVKGMNARVSIIAVPDVDTKQLQTIATVVPVADMPKLFVQP